MSKTFDIVLSRLLTPKETVNALEEMLPLGLRIDVGHEMSDLPDEPGAIWALITSTDDPEWPCVFNCLVCADECDLGPFPDLRVADRLFRHLGVNCLCGTYEFAGDLYPYDPYWSLACVSGKWFLASTSGTVLMGPYTDGIQSFPGDKKVRLIHSVELPAKVFA